MYLALFTMLQQVTPLARGLVSFDLDGVQFLGTIALGMLDSLHKDSFAILCMVILTSTLASASASPARIAPTNGRGFIVVVCIQTSDSTFEKAFGCDCQLLSCSLPLPEEFPACRQLRYSQAFRRRATNCIRHCISGMQHLEVEPAGSVPFSPRLPSARTHHCLE